MNDLVLRLPSDILNHHVLKFLDVNDMVAFNATLAYDLRLRRPLKAKQKIKLCSAFNVLSVKQFLKSFELLTHFEFDLMHDSDPNITWTAKEKKDILSNLRSQKIIDFLEKKEDYKYLCESHEPFKVTLSQKIEELKSCCENYSLHDDTVKKFKSLKMLDEPFFWGPSFPRPSICKA